MKKKVQKKEKKRNYVLKEGQKEKVGGGGAQLKGE